MISESILQMSPDTITSNESGSKMDTRVGVGIHMVVLIVSYLLIVLKIGPSFMKSRPPFQLKGFIIIYNICQIVACIYILREIITIDLPIFVYGACDWIKPGSVVEKHFNHIATFIFWLKASEMIETVVFTLRKKQNQISFLHVFHHCAMLFLALNLNVTYRNSAALFPLVLNSAIHIVMYIYYLLAAVLPSRIVTFLIPFKKAITVIQMIQFTVILIQVVIAKSHGCYIPEIMLVLYLIIIIFFLYGFYDFYKKSYVQKAKAKQAQK